MSEGATAVSVDKVIADADSNEAMAQCGASPVQWIPRDHIGRVHVTVPRGYYKKQSRGGGHYYPYRLRHVVVFHESDLVYRYDEVDVNDEALKRTFYAATLPVLIGVLRDDTPEEQYGKFRFEPANKTDKDRAKTWIEEAIDRGSNGRIEFTTPGENQKAILDDVDDAPEL